MTLKEVFEKYTVAEIGQEMANRGHEVLIDNVVYDKGRTIATEKQLRLIEEIKQRLGVVFKGTTLAEASKFIGENLPYLNNDKTEITPKQREFINQICEELSVKFVGLYKSDASDFIKEHLDRYNSRSKSGLSARSRFDNSPRFAGGDFSREDYCGISPYDIYDEYDMPSLF